MSANSARPFPLMKVFVAVSLVLTSSLLAQTPAPGLSSGKHPFTFEDMMKLKRVGAAVPSPDGKWVLFDGEDVDLEANKKISHLWIVPAQGGESRRLNPTPNHEERPRFSPDGKQLIWTSKATDPTQIWMCDFDLNAGALAGQPHQVTNISTGADGGIWSPDGKNIVFVSAVYPDCKDDACNKQRDDELKKSKVKAKIFTKLFYRHWNAFTEFKRSHLFVQNVEAGVSPADSRLTQPPLHQEARDLTPGDHDVPPFHLGGQDMYAISPDGQELAYTSAATVEGAVEDVVFPRRASLGAQAAEFAAVVPDRERLGRSVVQMNWRDIVRHVPKFGTRQRASLQPHLRRRPNE